MEAQLEVERKYDVTAGVPVPDLVRLPKVASVEAPWIDLEAVYYDTDNRACFVPR